MGKKVNECREKPSSACTCILFQPFSPRLTEPILNFEQEAGSSFYGSSAKAKNYFTGVNKAKCLPPTKVTYSHTGFHNGQAKYFNMKVQQTVDLLSWSTAGIVTVYCYMSRISQT